MEEVVGLEPTHVGFAIRGITSFAIAPKKIIIFLCIYFYKKSGRGQGIRTLGGFHLAGFQNRYNRPTLSILYNLMVRMVRIELTLRNRNGILSPARLPIPPHSHMCIIKISKEMVARDRIELSTQGFSILCSTD